MLDLQNTFLIATAILNIGLGLFLYIQSERRTVNYIFGTFVACIAGWAGSLFIFRIVADNFLALLSVRIAFVMALIVGFSLFYFSWEFPESKEYNKSWLIYLLLIVVATFSMVIINSGFLVERVAEIESGKRFFSNELGYLTYSIVFVGLFGVGLIQLWKKYFKATGQLRRQLFFISISITISGLIGTYLNLYLPSPLVENFDLIYTGPLVTGFLVLGIVYSIYRHELFNTKIVATEILTFFIWIIIFIRSLLIETPESILWRYGFLVIVTVFGVYLVRSVNKQVQAKEEAEELAEELRHLNEQKSKMLSIASHQFRTPLTSIEGYASLIENKSYGQVPKKLQEPINRILTSSKKLATIVDDFLNISRIEDGRMEYNFQVADLEEIVREVVEEAESTIDKEKLRLEIETDEASNYSARVDIGKIQQVITNLIDNAIKYTGSGSITARLKNKNGHVLIEIEDTGIGIDPEDADEIFKQFSRADEAQDVNVVGSGLGLYIAKQIVEAHDGEIWATSPGKGEGSTFHVKLATADEGSLDSEGEDGEPEEGEV